MTVLQLLVQHSAVEHCASGVAGRADGGMAGQGCCVSA